MATDNTARTRRKAASPPPPRRLVSAAAGAEYLDISLRTMRSYIRDGHIPAYGVGPHLVKVDLNDLDAFVRPIPAAAR